MDTTLPTSEELISFVTNHDKRVAFLVGSPLSTNAGLGVPDVHSMLPLVRDYIEKNYKTELHRLEAKLKGTTGAAAYQAAMIWLQHSLGQDKVNDVITLAVRRARKAGAPQLFKDDGEPEDWNIPCGTTDLARLITSRKDGHYGPILTTNFDPLLKLAISGAGGSPQSQVITADTSVTDPAQVDSRASLIVHLHGYWRGADTLHTPTQLTGERHNLAASLKRLLRD